MNERDARSLGCCFITGVLLGFVGITGLSVYIRSCDNELTRPRQTAEIRVQTPAHTDRNYYPYDRTFDMNYDSGDNSESSGYR